MSTVGIVCEYNPFHKGHLYQIEQAKELTGAQNVICFMSGNFLQRGVPALCDKFTRAAAALECGVDIIFEIPFVYASSSARDYATAAVTMMNATCAIDYICFGAETDDLELLSSIADLTEKEPVSISSQIKKSMASGSTYGAARADAISDYLCRSTSYLKDELDSILSSPNNILAIEYIAALKRTNSSIKPCIVKRNIAGYNSLETSNDICSASAIRYSLENNNSLDSIRRHIPEKCYDILSPCYGHCFPVFEDALSGLLQSTRLFNEGCISALDTKPNIVDMDQDLYNRLSKLDPYLSFSETAAALKCRNYTLTHIQRALLHYIMQLDAAEYDGFKTDGWIFYLRLMGLNTKSGYIIKEIKNNTDIPVITRAPEALSALSEKGLSMYRYDIHAGSVYNYLIYNTYKTRNKNEFERTIPIITPHGKNIS